MGSLTIEPCPERRKRKMALSQQVFGLNRLSDLPELRERAQEVLEGLEKGRV